MFIVRVVSRGVPAVGVAACLSLAVAAPVASRSLSSAAAAAAPTAASTPDDVLAFWLGDDRPLHMQMRWFQGDDALDKEITGRFSPLVHRALDGELKAWEANPRTALALVILLDQFTRNVFRSQPKAFAGDAEALRIAIRAWKEGWAPSPDADPFESMFFLMPLQHSESKDIQKLSLRAFARTADVAEASGSSEDVVHALRMAHKYAAEHEAIIARFGRYPHRNKILGRESTPEEVAYLKDGGQSFGQ